MDLYELPDLMQQFITSELEQGERIRWVAQPVPRTTIPRAAFAPVLFAIPWTLFSLFWMAAAGGILDQGFGWERLLFASFGIPFVAIGFGMLGSPFWIRRRIRRAVENTAYVITDRRVLIIDGGYHGDSGVASIVAGVFPWMSNGRTIRTFEFNDLTNLERNQHPDGSGDIMFGETVLGTRVNGVPQIARQGFYSIPDVKEVERMLRDSMQFN